MERLRIRVCSLLLPQCTAVLRLNRNRYKRWQEGDNVGVFDCVTFIKIDMLKAFQWTELKLGCDTVEVDLLNTVAPVKYANIENQISWRTCLV